MTIRGKQVATATASLPGAMPAAQFGARLQKKTVTITRAMLTDAVVGEAQAVNLGSVFANEAMIVGFRINVAAVFSGGGVSAVGMTTGTAVAPVNFIGSFGIGVDLFTGSPLGVRAPDASFTTVTETAIVPAGTQLTATFTPDAGHALSALTTGSVTIDVYYFETF